ncbi:hypothetical protein [Pseudophaeobacter sp.]|jgi:hypothetical protein|uniref:hypothetical protein n=1 Tax=Pseudophaeobacter sp. TaxID=1971739 RepID=UPI0032D95C43
MDNKEASQFQRMAVRAMLFKNAKYALIVCGIAYLAGSVWWLLLMIPSSLLAILRTNAQVETGAYMTARGEALRARQESDSTYGEDVVRAEPADELVDYISQVENIIEFWGYKELVLSTQVGDKKFFEKCALFFGEGFDRRIKPQFVALTTIDAAKRLEERGQEFAFEWFDNMRENINDFNKL